MRYESYIKSLSRWCCHVSPDASGWSSGDYAQELRIVALGFVRSKRPWTKSHVWQALRRKAVDLVRSGQTYCTATEELAHIPPDQSSGPRSIEAMAQLRIIWTRDPYIVTMCARVMEVGWVRAAKEANMPMPSYRWILEVWREETNA